MTKNVILRAISLSNNSVFGALYSIFTSIWASLNLLCFGVMASILLVLYLSSNMGVLMWASFLSDDSMCSMISSKY